jgi:hypothetical protein
VKKKLILALKEKNYWCITPGEKYAVLIPSRFPLGQLHQVDDCVIAKVNKALVRLRPIDCYDKKGLYMENHTISGCDVLL